ncbi:MAG TPA: neutral zinc metallopeptidase [Caulobacterales bacterium]|jgi:predicted metalloprotease|nr:neutral zinc metallopeptidase [Caulobacterales bacterium]
MRLDDQRGSSDVEDRRGMGGGGGGGFGGGLPFSLGHLSFGSIVLIVVFALLFQINPLDLLGGGGGQVATTEAGKSGTPSDAVGLFASRVLGSTEDVWSAQFAAGKVPNAPTTYTHPTLVLFDGAVNSGCGGASASMGPFYCPLDQKLYLDTSFFNELSSKFGAPGDFAQAYVIAHEIGHHIQKLTGRSDKAMEAQRSMGKTQYNAYSVKMELQADCYAGVWGHDAAAKGQVEPSDPDEALKAATAIGDDTLQKAGQGRVVPDSFTHGSSEQRVRWFKKGFDSGDPKQCDTFSAASL